MLNPFARAALVGALLIVGSQSPASGFHDPVGDPAPWECGGPPTSFTIDFAGPIQIPAHSGFAGIAGELVTRAKNAITCPQCPDSGRCESGAWVADWDDYTVIPDGPYADLAWVHGWVINVICLSC